jgi:hypothetical protein
LSSFFIVFALSDKYWYNPNSRGLSVAKIKKYNLAGVNANVELGKQGSYISGNAEAVAFYTKDDQPQRIAIANATQSNQAVTKAQLDQLSSDLVQHVTIAFDYDSGVSNVATVTAGTRILGVTVDIPDVWEGVSNNATTYVEVGDAENSSRYIRAKDVDVLVAGQYHNQYQYEYADAGVITLSVTAGQATAGTGVISLLLSTGTVTITDFGALGVPATSVQDLGNIA